MCKSATAEWITLRTHELLQQMQQRIYGETDRLFAGLMLFQWLAGMAVAFWVSPRTWAGRFSDVHIHVFAAVLIGGLITVWPVFLVMVKPRQAITRHSIAIGQTLFSALLIHLTGGRIETHFHIFGSLAFLSFYRDWKVLATASAVVAIDHLVRGLYFPQSVYGVAAVEPWRWLEHVWWVVFEDFFLIRSCLCNRHEMELIARREAESEATNKRIEETVEARTHELLLLNEKQERSIELQKRSEENLRRNQEFTRSIIESAQDAFIAIDVNSVITDWNAQAEKTFGWSRADALGQTLDKTMNLYQFDGKRSVGLLDLLASSESCLLNRLMELRAVHRDGHEFAVELTIFPVEAAGISRYCAFIRDITERKAAEKRVSEFYSMVSHELRTPLTSIRGALGLIEGGVVDSELEVKEMVGVARSSAERLIRLINDMLDLKKIEAGKMELHHDEVQVKELVSDALAALNGMAEEAGIRLLRACIAEVNVCADRDKATQVLTNLLSNAIKFSPWGSEVSVEAAPVQNNFVRISVLDHGPGVSGQDMHRLFDKFQQLDSSDSRQKGGTGLGLAISKALVEQQGGRIGVDSSPGNGSTFWFELPVLRSAGEAPCPETSVSGRSSAALRSARPAGAVPPAAQSSASFPARGPDSVPGADSDSAFAPDAVPDAATAGSFHGSEAATAPSPASFSPAPQPWRSILLVADDPDLAAGLGLLVRSQGFGVDRANSLSEAIRLCSTMIPDVVVLDFVLPDGNGVDLIKTLRKRKETRDTPVIVIAGHSGVGPREPDSGVLDWFYEPRMTALLKAIECAISSPGQYRVTVMDDDAGIKRIIATQLKSLDSALK